MQCCHLVRRHNGEKYTRHTFPFFANGGALTIQLLNYYVWRAQVGGCCPTGIFIIAAVKTMFGVIESGKIPFGRTFIANIEWPLKKSSDLLSLKFFFS